MRQAASASLRGAVALAASTALACSSHETTTPTPPLAIRCAAVPPGGTAPLSVAFALEVQNAVGPLAFVISYGDGTQGSDPDARHVYSAAGEYVASITSSSANQTARCSVPISVAPASPVPPALNGWPDASFRTTPAAIGSTITGRAPPTSAPSTSDSASSRPPRCWIRVDVRSRPRIP